MDNEDFLEFDGFLKNMEKSSQIRYVNLNFCGFSETINPCFTHLDINFCLIDSKRLFEKLKEFTLENFGINLMQSRTFFVDVNENINKNLFEIKIHEIYSSEYLKLLQTEFKSEFIKIFIKD